ncbi:MAG: FAD-binding oxidoreductase [Planctomycetota bacterium]|nr:FAD-binding oxidoreductase [Planctomycetota bacterium]
MADVLALSKHWRRAEPSSLERAFYGDDIDRLLPESYEELSETVRFAEASGRPLIPAGRGSHAYLGNPPPPRAVVVSLERLASVLRYEPDDFTIGVQTGLPLKELREILRENGQDVVGDFARGATGTVGGHVASALPGPRRTRCGALRSSLIGVQGMRTGGRMFRAGGMVVKNVAGYEVGKFLVGSLGTAGVIVEANFKLRPLPAVREGGRAAFRDFRDAWSFARCLVDRRLDPAAVTVLSGQAAQRLRGESSSPDTAPWEVVWLFEGNRTLVGWLGNQAEKLVVETRPLDDSSLADEEAARVFDGLCRRWEPIAPLEADEAVVRLSLLATEVPGVVRSLDAMLEAHPALERELQADAASGQVVLRWRGDDGLEEPLRAIPDILRPLGRAGWLIYLPPELRARWSYQLLVDPCRSVAQRILDVFDPLGVFCPGRLLGPAAPGTG